MFFEKHFIFSFSPITILQTICIYAHDQSCKNFIMIDSRIYEITENSFLLLVGYSRVVEKERIIEVLHVKMIMRFYSYYDVQIVYTRNVVL